MNGMPDNSLIAVDELIKVTISLSTERDLKRLLHMIVSSARKLTHADAGAVYILDSTKRNLYADVSQCDSLDSIACNLPFVSLYEEADRNTANVVAYSTFSGKPIHIADIYRYSGFSFEDLYSYDQRTGYRTQSLTAIPLLNHEKLTIGVLLLINIKNPQTQKIIALPDTLERIVAGFASQAAVAIDNVQLIEKNKQLIEILDRTNRDLEEENRRLKDTLQRKYDFSKIVGHGKRMQEVFSLIEKVGDSSATVFIHGETGTGKELITKAIHYNSPRKKMAFVAQNCAAFPENLLESELFGYKKGAFSGATADKKGLIEMANNGTLFLDEIGDMPLNLQAKLLRVLQEKEVRPLGALEAQKVDIRVIAATHADLLERIKQGDFREDLYYRLCVFPIELPPMRERKEDLPALLQHFLESFSTMYEKKVQGISPAALDCLLGYDYPGNIRELRNIIERAMLLCEHEGNIMPEHLPQHLVLAQPEQAASVVPELEIGEAGLKRAVEEVEAKLITEKLRECNWNQTKAAAELQISRRALVDKISRYGIARA